MIFLMILIEPRWVGLDLFERKKIQICSENNILSKHQIPGPYLLDTDTVGPLV